MTTSASAISSDPTTLAERYRAVRAHTEALAAPLGAEDQPIQSMPDVSPTKWHRAHTTWFFETFVLGTPGAFDPSYAYLFNSYYEAVGPRHARHARGVITRPGIAEVAAYREHVDRAMLTFLACRRAGQGWRPRRNRPRTRAPSGCTTTRA